MPALRVNQISVGNIIAAGTEPAGARRDIGGEVTASDGTLRVTRQTRKRDLRLTSVFLSEADAHAVESLLTGEGEVWNFDTLYGSKGLGPSAQFGVTLPTGATKFGTAKLNLQATTGTISFSNPAVNSFANTTALTWTVSVWRSTDSGVSWTNYIVVGAGAAAVAKWVDGVRNDGASTTWLTVSGAGAVSLVNTTGAAVQYDDLVVLPFAIAYGWAPQLGTMTIPWAPLPYLDISGDWVTEQPYRRVLGSVDDMRTKVAGSRPVRLNIELKAR